MKRLRVVKKTIPLFDDWIDNLKDFTSPLKIENIQWNHYIKITRWPLIKSKRNVGDFLTVTVYWRTFTYNRPDKRYSYNNYTLIDQWDTIYRNILRASKELKHLLPIPDSIQNEYFLQEYLQRYLKQNPRIQWDCKNITYYSLHKLAPHDKKDY